MSKKEAKVRLKKIENLIAQNNYRFRQNLSGSLEVLVEEFKDGYYVGYDQYFNLMSIKSDEDISKTWVNIEQYSVQKERNYAVFKTQ